MSREKNIFFNKGILLGLKRECKEDIDMLKRIYGVFNYQELADKLEITESAIKGWVKRKIIPDKYMKIIEEHRIHSINNFFENYPIDIKKESTNNGTIQINGNNNGHININSSDEMSMEICKEIKKLSDVKKEYYYHLIKADVLKEQIGN